MPEETWSGINQALISGGRGLPGGTSLSQFLTPLRAELGIVGSMDKSTLTEQRILEAARKYFRNNEKMPTADTTDAVPGLPHESWAGINSALIAGNRGLTGGSSLSKLLAPLRAQVGVVGKRDRGTLDENVIMTAARAYFKAHGRLPTQTSTLPVPGMANERWDLIDNALVKGNRGLPGGSSLSKLLGPLRREVGITGKTEKSNLAEHGIIKAARAYYRQKGKLPSAAIKDEVPGMPGEKWSAINDSLAGGFRGLPGGSSLSKLLAPLRKELSL